MTNAYTLAKQHLDVGVTEAESNNIDSHAYGQALIWKVLEMYKENGRSGADIVAEVQYTLDNLDDDGTFHVSRN
jgi:hypothetical protein